MIPCRARLTERPDALDHIDKPSGLNIAKRHRTSWRMLVKPTLTSEDNKVSLVRSDDKGLYIIANGSKYRPGEVRGYSHAHDMSTGNLKLGQHVVTRKVPQAPHCFAYTDLLCSCGTQRTIEMISHTNPAWFDQLIELNEHMKRATSLAALAWCVADLRRQGADKEADAALCVGKYGFDPDDKLTDADFAERIDNISKANFVGWIRPAIGDGPDGVEASYVTVQGPDNKRVRRTFRVKPELARTIIAAGQFRDFPNMQHKGEAPGKVADDFMKSLNIKVQDA